MKKIIIALLVSSNILLLAGCGLPPEIFHFCEYSEWQIESEATCTSNGKESRVCLIDGDIDTREIPALGHTTTNGVCDRCGVKIEDTVSELVTEPIVDSNKNSDSSTTLGKDMVKQFVALGFSESESKQMKDIFSVVGITEISDIQKGPGTGIDELQCFTCNIFDYDKSKGGLSLTFTIENRQLCYIELAGIPTQKIDYFYINIFGNVKAKTSNSKKSVVLYDIWDEYGEIDPNAIGYKAVFDYDKMAISAYK